MNVTAILKSSMKAISVNITDAGLGEYGAAESKLSGDSSGMTFVSPDSIPTANVMAI